jgi:small-conductance mechanosensitive channel
MKSVVLLPTLKDMDQVLHRTFWNNSLLDYLISLGIILIGLLFVKAIRKWFLRHIKSWAGKTETNIDDYLIDGIERFVLPMANFLIIYVALSYLDFSPRAEKILHVALIVIVTFYCVQLIASFLRLLLESHVRRQDRGDEKVKQMKGVMVVITIVIWILGGVFLFDNLGYDVTAILTGLGIGGIAIALALQNILGDLFNYFVIFFDRPFEIGDAIILDDKNDTVEYIGIKTTRLKALGGEQLILSNSDLTKSRLHNFKRMERRRIAFTLAVDYETSLENLKEIPEIIKKLIQEHKDLSFDRTHFLAYGTHGLNFEVVFFVESSDYNHYADMQQTINLKIYEIFKQKGIKFAYPAQPLLITPENKM